MLHRRSLLLGAATLAVGGALAGCGGSKPSSTLPADASGDFGFQREGLPITQRPLPLKYSGTKSALAPDFETMQLVQQWKSDTNVDITWNNLPDAVFAEKKNLMLASGDLPDALFNTGLSDAEVVTNGTNGVLIPLEGLIKEYAPILSGILAKRPDIRSAITASDGHIYTLPSVEELGILSYPNFLFINKAWLSQAGLGVPTTVAEFKAALTAFKARGKGVIPWSFKIDHFCANPWDFIAAVGGLPDNNDHRIVQDHKVIYTAAREEWRQGVRELGQWYKQGLIDPESFSHDDTAYLAKGKADPVALGAFYWWELKEVVGDTNVADYAHVGILKGTDGRQRASVSNFQEINRGSFAITSANKFPAATMRWVDRLYDPVMSAQTAWGPLGVTLAKDANGILVQIPVKPGESEGERRQKVAPGGPRITTAEDFKTVVAPEPRAKERQDLVKEFYEPFKANDKYPPVLMSNEELDRIAQPMTDISALVKQKLATWVVNGNVDSEWGTYTKQLDSLGLKEIMNVYQTAYDRYRANA